MDEHYPSFHVCFCFLSVWNAPLKQFLIKNQMEFVYLRRGKKLIWIKLNEDRQFFKYVICIFSCYSGIFSSYKFCHPFHAFPFINTRATSTPLRCGLFSEKTLKKSSCTIMVRIIITFRNQIFLWLIWL